MTEARCSPDARRGRPAGCGGSILLEVLVATLLVGLVVVPLATAFSGAVGQSRLVRQAAGAAIQNGADGTKSKIAGAWEWGPSVVAAWWSPGPALHVRLSGAGGDEAAATILGVWVDGMLVEERMARGDTVTTSADGETDVEAATWSSLEGRELVVRARREGGVWGPPWRLEVASPSGETPAPGAVLPGSSDSPSVVAHRPATGTSPLAVSWSATPLPAPPFGLLFVLDSVVHGWAGATLDQRSQWWPMEEGRSVDLYF